jgi:hypothetical protein
MAKQNPYDTPARKQHPVKFNPNPPAPSVAQALANSKKQVDAAK